MKRRIQKMIIAILLMISVSRTISAASISGNIIEPNKKEKQICIILNEKGLYSEAESYWYSVGNSNIQESDIVWVDEIGGEIFQDKQNNRYFSRLSTNDFIEVGKVEIDINAYENYLNGGWAEFPESVVHFNKSFALN